MENTTLYIATHNKTGLKYFGKTTRYFTQTALQSKYHGSGIYWKDHLRKHGDDVTMEIYGIFSNNVTQEALKFSKENNIVGSNNWANLIEEDGIGSVPYHSELTKKKISINTKKNMTKELKEEMSLLKKDTVAVINDDGKKFRVTKEVFDKSDNLYGHTKGKVTVRNKITGNIESVKKGYDKEIYEGVNKGYKATGISKINHELAGKKREGANNGSAKIINILNNNGEIEYKCHGNMRIICEENNLPLNILRQTIKSKKPVKSKKYKHFNGWIAKEQIKDINENI